METQIQTYDTKKQLTPNATWGIVKKMSWTE